MNIIVIGSQGFIGSHLCAHFVKGGHKVYGADVLETPPNLKYQYVKVSRLSAQWEELLQLTKFDICINAAGSGNVSYSVQYPVIDFEANTLDVMRLLDALRKYGQGCKYLHISSAAVYGNPTELPVSESSQLEPISPYGFHKLMSEVLCKEYYKLYDIDVVVLRPFSIFGNGLHKQLLWDICNKVKNNNTVTLFGTGNETRDFIHIKDFVRLVDILLMQGDFNCNIYNVASGTEISIKKVATIFENCFGNGTKIIFNGEVKQGDPTNWRADVSKIKALGFEPEVDFETGVIDYIKWFSELNAN